MKDLRTCVPSEMQELNQWCRYRAEWNEETKRYKKVPISPDIGEPIDITKAENLRSFETALNSPHGEGLGFALLVGGKLIGEDFDDILLDQKTVHPSFGAEVDLTTYAEITPSGRGIHQFYYCDEPFEAPEPRLTVQGKSWELYSRDRYLTVTGDTFSGAANTVRKVGADFIRKKALVRRIIKALSAFDKTQRLVHEADSWQSLGYPSQSEADFFLLGQIKAHTSDEEVGLRVFRLSALFRGDAKGKDYLHTTWEKVEQAARVVTLEELEVSPDEKTDDRFVLWFGDTPVGKKANITIIRAIAKQGKTHTVHALGAALAGDGVDTLGFTVDKTVTGITIIDTEQDRSDISALQRATIKRVKGQALPGLRSLSFRGKVGRGPQSVERLEAVLKKYTPQIVCLDVITDFVRDTNSIEEASDVVGKLEEFAVRYDTCIVGTIHTGASQEAQAKGARGSIGSELERRAFATLMLQKCVLSVAACRRGRAGTQVAIRWDDEMKSYASSQVAQGQQQRSEARALFGSDTQLPRSRATGSHHGGQEGAEIEGTAANQ